MENREEIRRLVEQRDAAYMRGDMREVERIDRKLQALAAEASRPVKRAEKRVPEHELRIR